MKKIIGLLLIIAVVENSFCQAVIINGVNNNRLLTWNDFTGKPDKSSGFQANTFWEINYGFKGIDFAGDTVLLKGFLVTLKFNENKSWVKEGTQTTGLLKHEQGHFDIGLICQNEIIRQINSSVLLKTNFKDTIISIFTNTMKKYHLMGLRYDEETDHSKNQQNQDKWNDFIYKALQQ
jgi:hypothetical protein